MQGSNPLCHCTLILQDFMQCNCVHLLQSPMFWRWYFHQERGGSLPRQGRGCRRCVLGPTYTRFYCYQRSANSRNCLESTRANILMINNPCRQSLQKIRISTWKHNYRLHHKFLCRLWFKLLFIMAPISMWAANNRSSSAVQVTRSVLEMPPLRAFLKNIARKRERWSLQNPFVHRKIHSHQCPRDPPTTVGKMPLPWIFFREGIRRHDLRTVSHSCQVNSCGSLQCCRFNKPMLSIQQATPVGPASLWPWSISISLQMTRPR